MVKKVCIKNSIICFLIIILNSVLIFPTGNLANNTNPEKLIKSDEVKEEKDIQVPPPPFSEGIFPCSDCHNDLEANPERRELDAHEEIKLNHDEQNRWCMDCHDKKNRDMLHLASGQLVSFNESYKLCGQCHGPKLRDWKNGIHGRRTGKWNGQKKYLLCAHCHNPHTPKYKHVKPEPPPLPGKGPKVIKEEKK